MKQNRMTAHESYNLSRGITTRSLQIKNLEASRKYWMRRAVKAENKLQTIRESITIG